MKANALECLLFSWFFCATAERFRILLLPHTDYYNSFAMELLAAGNELVKRGHDVYISMADTDVQGNFFSHLPSNITVLKYRIEEHIPTLFEIDKKIMEEYFKGNFTPTLITLSLTMHKASLNDVEFLAKLRSLKFDMVLATTFVYQFVLARSLNIPYAFISSLNKPFLGGSPTLPIYPVYTLLQYNDRMNFWQRLNNFIHLTVYNLYTTSGWYGPEEWINEFYNQYCPGITNEQIISEAQIYFITSDHLLEWPLPVMPNVKLTPPLLYSPAKALSSEFEALATSPSSSKYGMIIVSFGTFTHHLSGESIHKMLQVFKRLNQTIIWKVATLDFAKKLEEKRVDTISNLPENIHIFSHIPQNDLLGHENTKLFITHSGNNGQYEATYHGIPMVALYLFFDQPHNAFRITDHGFGVLLDFQTFTSEELFVAINEILSNDKYRKNINKASAIIRDYPMTGRESVAYWIEHVIKFGNNHLKSNAVILPWYEYFMVDVIMTISAGLVFIIYITAFGLRRINQCARLK